MLSEYAAAPLQMVTGGSVFTSAEAFLLGAAAIALLLLVVEVIARFAHSSFLTSVIMGADNRTSTSKTFIFMWTLLVAWALASLVIAGELINTHSCAAGSVVASLITSCRSKHDYVGLLQIGWKQFVASGLTQGYLVLLGVPAAAAVSAKAITQSKSDAGTVVKSTAPEKQGILPRVAQVFSADDQTTDIGDFQYMVFNLILAAYFVARFLQANGDGLPALPDTLLGLTSVSAALYVGKKAATRNQPTITGVFPAILRAGQPFTVTGSGLTVDPTQNPPVPGVMALQVTVNGVPALNVVPDPAVPDRLTATAPAGMVPAGAAPPVAGTVQALSAFGAITPGFGVQCA
jgi:hypothetical protein